MKKCVYVCLSACFLSVTVYAAAAGGAGSSEIRDAEVPLPTTMERYYLKNGTLVERSNKLVTIGSFSARRIYCQKECCGTSLIVPLNISADQSQEDFLKALEHTGAFSREDDLEKKRKSNWTRSYLTKLNVLVIHTPEIIKLGIKSFLSCNISDTINNLRLHAPLKLDLFKTEEEFASSLIASGLYDPAYEVEKMAAKNWTRSYLTKLDIPLTHTPERIECGLLSTQSFLAEEVFGDFPLSSPLRLSIYLTEEEFTAALITSGLYNPAEEALKMTAKNWTGSFITKTGITIKHTPKSISIDGQSMDKFELDVDDVAFDVIAPTSKLYLSKYQTKEEFTEALISSGIYDPADEAAKLLAKNWTGSIFTKAYVHIRHTPDGVGFSTLREHIEMYGTLNSLKLERPLFVNCYQTRDQIKAALEYSGLLFQPEEEAEVKSKADWDGSFTLKNGAELFHTKDGILVDPINISVCCFEETSIWGLKPKAPFFLHTYMLPEEFEAELKRGDLL